MARCCIQYQLACKRLHPSFHIAEPNAFFNVFYIEAVAIVSGPHFYGIAGTGY